MKASDVMVSNVITAKPDACVQDVAKLLLENRISAVPIVDERGALVGVVSEGDLMRHVETGAARRRPWWLQMMMGSEALADAYVKEHARKVADLMTRKVITANPDTSLSDVARLLERNGIKRVPIVKNEKIVGIVSRANLLRALASLGKEIERPRTADDNAIRNQVEAQYKVQPWAKPGLVNVIVHDGTVELWGIVNSEAEKKAMRVAAEVTPGVRAVNDNLVIRPIAYGM